MVIAFTQYVDTFIFFTFISWDLFSGSYGGWQVLFELGYDLTLFGIGEHCKEILPRRALT